MNRADETEEAIFTAAQLLKNSAKRRAYLDLACDGDPDLRRRMERLLASSSGAEDFFKRSAAVVPHVPVPPDATFANPISEAPNSVIGRYKLLEKIGEGGMGVVYMAEQEQPVRRKVALKIIKLGMDTRQVVARFEAERQALALMDHPNIAKVLDAGATDSGRPFFVMELVQGVPITRFCDENRLSTEDRLKLFIPVCKAIQSAHQKGIIHRDIKPSNVLVTLNAGVPHPMVIDFGVAKATNQKLTEKTLFTNFATMIGTPAYMSPEQAEMSKLDVDTCSDIYSLGVLLYELLTGTTPFPEKRLRSVAYREMQRIIVEEEPERPSTVVERLSKLRVERGEAAAPSSTLNAQLTSLSTDLDWIVMKCLEKDRARRYETANGLAADIQRHLSNELVIARPPSANYRFRKMVRRNRLAFVASTAVFAALVAGLAGTLWMFFQANIARKSEEAARQAAVRDRDQAIEQRQRAEQAEKKAADEAAIAGAVSDFLRDDLLRAAGTEFQSDFLSMPGNPNLTVVEAVDRAADGIVGRFPNQPLVEAAIRYTLGRTYSDLGDHWSAISHLERSLELRRRSLGANHEEVHWSMGALANAFDGAGQYGDAIPLYEKVLEYARNHFGAGHEEIITSLNNLGSAYAYANRPADAIRLHEEALKASEATHGSDSTEVAWSLNRLGLAYSLLNQPVKAIEFTEKSLKLFKAKLGPDHPTTIGLTHNLGNFHLQAGDLSNAQPLLEEALRLGKARLGAEHPNTLNTVKKLAKLYQTLGREAEAEALHRESLDITRKLEARRPERTATSLRSLADFFVEKGRTADAEPLSREAWQLIRKTRTNELANLNSSFNALAEFLFRERRPADLDQLFDEELSRETSDPIRAASLRHSRGNYRARSGRWSDAVSDFRHTIQLQPDEHEYYHKLAPALFQSGDVEGYRRLRSEILARFADAKDPPVAERMAKDCLILTLTGAGLESAARMADTSVSAGTNQPFFAWFRHVKSLAQYRQGHFASAVEWAQTGGQPEREVQAYAVLAMANHRLDRTNESLAALASAREIAEAKLAKPESSDLRGLWNDWVIAHALLREAKTLIESQSGQTTEAEKKSESTKGSPQ